MKSNQIIVLALACAVTIALRFVELPMTNFGSLLALSLLCGFAIRSPWACLLPLGVRLLTDVGLQLKTGYGFFGNWYFDYTAYVLVALIGRQIANWEFLKKAASVVAVLALTTFACASGVWMLTSTLTVEQLQIIRPIVQFSAAFVLCYLAVLCVGNSLLQKVFAATAGSIAAYFLISNLGAWFYAPESYARSFSGLMICYVKGIPFVRASVLGNLLFAPVFFAAWNWATAAQTVPENSLALED